MDILKRFFIILLFIVSLSMLLNVFSLGIYPDFGVYYNGSKLFLEGENPYVLHQELFSNYVYPPFVLLIFVPFTYLPLFFAAKVWTGISIISLFVCVWLSFLLLKKKLSLQSFLFVATLVTISFPVKFTLGMGQINLAILFLTLLGVYFYSRERNFLSGVFFGLSIMLKFFPLLLIPYFFYKRKWRILLALTGTVGVLFTLSLFLIGSQLHVFFITHVFPGVLSAMQQDYYNQALSGFLARSTNLETGLILKSVVSVLLLTIVGFVIVKNKKKDDLSDISLLFTLSLLINSFSWQHHFVWLLLPFFYTYYQINGKGREKLFVFFVSFVLVASNIKEPTIVPLLFQSHVFWGAVLLLCLQLWIRYSKK